MIDKKLESLRCLLSGFKSALIAYSGGGDSVLLAYVANEVLAERSLAVIADSASLPRRELTEALAIADTFKIPIRIIKTAEFSSSEYTSNPFNRCYFCKHELFTELIPIAKELGFPVIAYGENASDVGDYRPGAQAAAEFNIRAPLKEVGLTKAEVRELSARFGLPTSNKPQMACLSSRVPHGERVTEQKLQMIEAAENCLRDNGFHDVRVRHHELPSQPALATPMTSPHLVHQAVTFNQPALARIEVGVSELSRLDDAALCTRILAALKQLGYASVTFDPQGYRRGGANDLTKPSNGWTGVQSLAIRQDHP
ncbi:MAG: ATP-dependent sacrificial sulfur transferase LarE [Verrucomicrobia bacterium]|nr:ATP-dependent sacrificial sulfur transferase LarE [Verrucomicrobiota bacterium]